MLDREWFRGKKVTVMGLGLFGGGAAVTRFLHGLGAEVTITDLRSEQVLAPSLASLDGLGLRFVLGRHDESDFEGADAVIVNPAVPPSSPFLAVARSRGVRLESETNLFFRACRSRWIVGVTGSNGKSTTTALTGAMLAEAGLPIRVGGNIGKPLIEEVFDIGVEDRVVLELSSFQLEDLDRLAVSPRIGVLTNLTPNHLDRHATMEAYVRAKETLFRHQAPGDTAVLNADDGRSRALAENVPGRVVLFSTAETLSEGFSLNGEALVARRSGEETVLLERKELSLPGRFNAANALAAAAASLAAGADPGAVGRAARAFRSIPHRLERIGERRGAVWYNDSIATTPESTVAALSAFQGGIVLIAGGYDKKLDLEPICRASAEKARAVVLMGATAGRLAEGLERAGGGPEIARAGSIEEAVGKAAALCRPRDAVILSPGAASYDMFLNFEERGNRFRELVLALPE
ncbi:MAG: UDP-N-acetylmuramoyl-L-alanine--D-glutamate ligase [Planctomycetota bacterium]|jgi:UDP-N-acetylmuramoylalanine--D-glutamate ligase